MVLAPSGMHIFNYLKDGLIIAQSHKVLENNKVNMQKSKLQATESVKGGENACSGNARLPQYTFCLVQQDQVRLGDQHGQGGQI